MFRTFASAQASVPAGGGVPSARPGASQQGWHPTVVYLVGLLAVEFVTVGFLSHYLLKES